MDGLRVSTITCCAELTTDINLTNLYRQIGIDDFIRYAENGDMNYKGFAEKNTKKKRKSKKNIL